MLLMNEGKEYLLAIMAICHEGTMAINAGDQTQMQIQNETTYTKWTSNEDNSTNRKPVCHFLLVDNTNWPTILHRFLVIVQDS